MTDRNSLTTQQLAVITAAQSLREDCLARCLHPHHSLFSLPLWNALTDAVDALKLSPSRDPICPTSTIFNTSYDSTKYLFPIIQTMVGTQLKFVNCYFEGMIFEGPLPKFIDCILIGCRLIDGQIIPDSPLNAADPAGDSVAYALAVFERYLRAAMSENMVRAVMADVRGELNRGVPRE